MGAYGVYTAHISAAALIWDAMLKITDIQLELFSDANMFSYLEKGLPGVSMITTRYPKANNQYLSTTDPQDPIKYILYLDANNLYGNAMSQCLPFKKFR